MDGNLIQINNRQVFGYIHEPVGSDQSKLPVLICPSLGHEYYRTHWCIRRLTTQLTRSGFTVGRFDYSGTGDSAGSLNDVASIQQWMEDTYGMACHLQNITESPQIHVLGLRMGAIFAAAVAATGMVDELVLWEPTRSAKHMLDQWRCMHETMIDLWMTPLKTVDDGRSEEILGAIYPRPILDELESFTFGNIADLKCTTATVVSTRKQLEWEQEGYQQRVVEEPSDWEQLSMIEQAWLPTQSPSSIRQILAQSALSKPIVHPVA